MSDFISPVLLGRCKLLSLRRELSKDEVPVINRRHIAVLIGRPVGYRQGPSGLFRPIKELKSPSAWLDAIQKTF